MRGVEGKEEGEFGSVMEGERKEEDYKKSRYDYRHIC